MGSRVRQRVEWTGRLLLLSAVAFWWGAVVIPQLISMTFPDVLPWSAISEQLRPNREGTLSNAVSGIALAVVAVLALGNTVRSLRSRDARTRIAIGGWTALAVTTAYLAVWEILSPRRPSTVYQLGYLVLGEEYRGHLWPVVYSPLIGAFLVVIGVFILKALPSPTVRFLMTIGVTCWILAIMHEANHALFRFTVTDIPQLRFLEELMEETLEFAGTLSIGLSAGISLTFARPVRSLGKLAMGAIAIAACVLAAGVLVPRLHEAPLADARADSPIGAFHMALHDKHSVIQELGVLPAPPARVDVRIASSQTDPTGRPAVLIWRLIESGQGRLGRIFREGRKEIPPRDYLAWETIDFTAPVEAEGRPLALQLIADVGPSAHLRIGATKTNRYGDGRLRVDGALGWPDQNIEFVAYSEPDLTRGKLYAMWRTFSSDWHWPVLAADVAIVMALIIFIPALLITAAVPRRTAR